MTVTNYIEIPINLAGGDFEVTVTKFLGQFVPDGIDYYLITGSGIQNADFTIDYKDTLILGMTYKFQWRALITAGGLGKVFIFDNEIPDQYAFSSFDATLRYNGVDWDIDYTKASMTDRFTVLKNPNNLTDAIQAGDWLTEVDGAGNIQTTQL